MDTQQERLSHLDHALSNGENICSSEGMLCSFPFVFALCRIEFVTVMGVFGTK